ncbi:MAG: hypothetical protein P4L51_04940 [Puia sp.]|nr:hypothetical protein [Puia sp.]
MNIEKYIETGIIEAYVMGLADHSERREFERILPTSPDLQQALLNFELKIEGLAMRHSSPPPPGTWELIQDRIRELPAIRPPAKERQAGSQNGNGGGTPEEFISIQAISSTHIKIHKHWKTAFITVFILSKIFLALAIYFFVEYRHAQKDIRQLQEQVDKVPAK